MKMHPSSLNVLFALGLALVVSSVACSSHEKKAEAPAPAPVPTTAAGATEIVKQKLADVKPGVAASTVVCSHGDDKRELAIEAKGSGCNLNYKKAGKTSSVATSANGSEHCEKTVQKIRSKLEASGYACK